MTIPREKIVLLRNRFLQITQEWEKKANEYTGPCPETHFEYCMMADAYRMSMMMVDEILREHIAWEEVV